MSQPLPEDIETLLQELRSQDASHRLKAVNSLANLKVIDRQILGALKSVAANDPDLIVRECAQDALPALRKGYIPSPQEKRIELLIGFIGWFVINGVLWVIASGTPVGIAYGIPNLILFPANVLVLIILARTRRWVALGVLIALAVNLLITLIMGVAFEGLCFIPFLTPGLR